MALRDVLRRPAEEQFLNARDFGEAAIRQGTWLATPLWRGYGWQAALKKQGLTWQDLMEACGDTQATFVAWSRGVAPWEAAVDALVARLEELRPR